MRLSDDGTAHGYSGPTNGESDVPLPVPYSLDDADGMLSASCEAVAAVVPVLLFVVDDTELTFTEVSTGSVWLEVDVFDEPEAEPLDVDGVTPDDNPAPALVFTGAGVAAVNGADDACATIDVEVDDDDVPADGAAEEAVPGAAVAAEPAALLDDDVPFALEAPAAPVVEPVEVDEPLVALEPDEELVPPLLAPADALALVPVEAVPAEPPPVLPVPPVPVVLAVVPAKAT